MKKIIIASVISFAVPFTAFASFDRNISYGMQGADVYQLQDVLSSEGCFAHESTGYFGLITLASVKCFQSAHSVPATGYVGVLTRAALNSIVIDETASSTEAMIEETGTTTVASPIGIPQNQVPVIPPVQAVPQVGAGFTKRCHVSPIAGSDSPVSFYSIEISGQYDHFDLTGTAIDASSSHQFSVSGASPASNVAPGSDYLPYKLVLGGPIGEEKDYSLKLYSGNDLVDSETGSVTFEACSL